MALRTRWGDHKQWGTFQWKGNGVKINNDYKDVYDISVDNVLTNEPDSASFYIIDTIANKPQEGSDVEIWYQTHKIFKGRIVTVQYNKLDGTSFEFYCECIDYTRDLDKKLVSEVYENKTLNEIVLDIIANYTTGFTTTNVAVSTPTLDYIQFNYVTPQECFQRLSEATGFDWYIDQDKDVHFFELNSPISNAPIELLDDGIEFDDLVISVDKTQIKNRIIIRGGYYLSDEYTQTIVADGEQTEFLFAYKPHDVSIKVNTVAKTLGIENIDAAGGHAFLMNFEEKTLKNDTATRLIAGDVLEMKYKFEVPVLCRVDDVTSQQAIMAIEGGDGIFEYLIGDDKLETLESARERGKAELNLYSNAIVTGSFTSFTAGWRAGQKLHIKLTDRGIDEYYLIKEVVIEGVGGDQMIYKITFATLLLGFTWLLLQILKKTGEAEVRDDEIINNLMTITEEATATDSAATVTKVSPPFNWSNDAGTTPGAGNWNFGQWSA